MRAAIRCAGGNLHPLPHDLHAPPLAVQTPHDALGAQQPPTTAGHQLLHPGQGIDWFTDLAPDMPQAVWQGMGGRPVKAAGARPAPGIVRRKRTQAQHQFELHAAVFAVDLRGARRVADKPVTQARPFRCGAAVQLVEDQQIRLPQLCAVE